MCVCVCLTSSSTTTLVVVFLWVIAPIIRTLLVGGQISLGSCITTGFASSAYWRFQVPCHTILGMLTLLVEILNGNV